MDAIVVIKGQLFGSTVSYFLKYCSFIVFTDSVVYPIYFF